MRIFQTYFINPFLGFVSLDGGKDQQVLQVPKKNIKMSIVEFANYRNPFCGVLSNRTIASPYLKSK